MPVGFWVCNSETAGQLDQTNTERGGLAVAPKQSRRRKTMEYQHDLRAAFCRCPKCTAARLIIHDENADRIVFEFKARQLGTYLDMAKQYQNGDLD